MPARRVNDQAVKAGMLQRMFQLFIMTPESGGPMAWGSGSADYEQGSARIVDGMVTDVRISNNKGNTWNDQLVERDGKPPFVRCQLPANGPVIPHVLDAFKATQGQFVTLRISIFEPDRPVTRDYSKQAKLVGLTRDANNDFYAEIHPVV